MCFSQLSLNNTGPEIGAQSFHQMCLTGFLRKPLRPVFTCMYIYLMSNQVFGNPVSFLDLLIGNSYTDLQLRNKLVSQSEFKQREQESH